MESASVLMTLVTEYPKDTAGIDQNISQWFHLYGCRSQSVASITHSWLCTRWGRCFASMTSGFSSLSVDHSPRVCLLPCCHFSLWRMVIMTTGCCMHCLKNEPCYCWIHRITSISYLSISCLPYRYCHHLSVSNLLHTCCVSDVDVI